MKAFGFRLAAGAVTILLGAIMAAQGQKTTTSENELETMAGVHVASPIPNGTESGTEFSFKWNDAETVTTDSAPKENDSESDFPQRSAVQLVQHVEPATTSDPAVSNGPAMIMSLPTFSNVADQETPAESPNSAAGPSQSIGLPSNGLLNDMRSDSGAVNDTLTAGAQNLNATAGSLAEKAVQEITGGQTQNANAASAPMNDLRGGGTFASDSFADLPPLPGSSQPVGDLPIEGQRRTVTSEDSAPSVSNQNLSTTPRAMLGAVTLPGQETPVDTQTNLQNQAQIRISNEPSVVMAPQAGNELQTGNGLQTGNALAAEANSPLSTATASAPQMNQYVPAQENYQTTVPATPNRYPASTQQSGPQFGMTQPLNTQPNANSPNRTTSVPAQIASTPTANTAPYRSIGYQQPNSPSDRVLPGPTMASPGERKLDGVQQPSVVIQKRAPEEVKVGKPATFVLHVQNVGTASALDVQVVDRIPAGMRLVDATPHPDPNRQPELYWTLGDLEAGEERTITLQLVPEQEGELGSVARVTFQAAASVRTVSTRPELKLQQEAPKQVLIGQQVEINLEVSNPGTGTATGVILQEDVPVGLEHPAGRQLDNMIGTLRPNEVRRQVLRMRATEPGVIQNTVRVKGDDGLETTHTVAIEVVAPQIQVALSGPSLRYLERQATFNVEFANVGTADATNVEFSVQLDRGFTFVSTDYEGQYDPTRHAVFWALENLPKGEQGKVPLTLLPVEEGERVLKLEANADLGVKANNERRVAVNSLAELTFSINDSADPVEVGGDTIYEIHVNNTGSRDDSNVQVQLQLPPGLQLVGNGDFQQIGQGAIAFQPTQVLKANGEVKFQVKARGVAPGTHLIKAIVVSDQSKTPVTKEESTTVYADQ